MEPTMPMPSEETIGNSVIVSSKIILRNKRLADARDDYTWESDSELAKLDAAFPVTTSFSQYLLDYVDQLRYSSSTKHRFAIETIEGKHIGNCSYYNIDEKKGEAELGIIIGNRGYWNKGYGADAVTTLVSYIFCQTKLKRIYLKTLDSNSRAQKCFQKCGFTQYGRLVKDGFSFTLMEIHRNQWQEQRTENLKQPSI